jgi:hypothetical protein
MTTAVASAYNAAYASAQTDTVYREKIITSMTKIANNVMAEPIGVMSQSKFDKRHAKAREVLGLSTGGVSGAPLVSVFALSVLTAGGGTVSDTEAQIDNAISAVWNNIAGVTTQD